MRKETSLAADPRSGLELPVDADVGRSYSIPCLLHNINEKIRMEQSMERSGVEITQQNEIDS